MICDRVLPLAMLLALASGYNYCNNKTHICNLGGLKHFMCRLDEELPSYRGTKFEEIVPETKYFKKEVLESLNQFRDMLASGQVTNKLNITFPSAKRMRRLIWDKELAYLARVHVSTVSFKHTECRSTLRFPLVGEMIAIMAAHVENKLTVGGVLRHAFRPMWKEHWNVTDPKSFSETFDPVSEFSAGHFALIVNDRIGCVGCSVAVGSNCPYKDSVDHCHFLTCYFDHNTIYNSSVYEAGTPTSGCSDWKTTGDTTWVHLCKNDGARYSTDAK